MLGHVGRSVGFVLLAVGVWACSTTREPEAPPAPPSVPTVPPAPTVPPPGAPATPAASVPEPDRPVKIAPKELMKPPSDESRAKRGVRPVRNPETDALLKQGKTVGPVITFLGMARADGTLVDPVGKDPKGIPIYENPIGSGFMLVVEGKPGLSNIEVGRKLFVYDADDPKARPDLEIQANRDLGDGSKAVCDRMRPNIGGMPAINPPNWSERLDIAHTLADWACRFETFIEPESACLVKKTGDFTFANPETTTQFCMVVARAWLFPEGETLVSARLRDAEGNPGPVAQVKIKRPTEADFRERARKFKAKPTPTPVPTPQRRRP